MRSLGRICSGKRQKGVFGELAFYVLCHEAHETCFALRINLAVHTIPIDLNHEATAMQSEIVQPNINTKSWSLADEQTI